MTSEIFPIDLGKLQPLKLDPAVRTLTDEQRTALRNNIQLVRDTIVFFTALAGARGLSGHTGGAYDTVPEVMIVRAFIANGAPIVPVIYDEAGHRVAAPARDHGLPIGLHLPPVPPALAETRDLAAPLRDPPGRTATRAQDRLVPGLGR